MMKHFKIEKNEDNIAIITLNRTNEEMNLLSEEVASELSDICDLLSDDTSYEGALFISGKNSHFIAGADINEIAKLNTVEKAQAGSMQLQAILQKVADLPFSTVAAIHGACLGGGLEFALACDWRVATDDDVTKLALPEIQLGLIPGAGGTQRLPRLIGIEKALDMILTGKKIASKKALKMGLVDACVPKTQLIEQAVIFAQKKKAKKSKLGILGIDLSLELPKWAIEGNPIGRKVMYKMAKEKVEQNTKGFYPAAYKALDAVFDGHDMSLKDGLKLEATLFGELVPTMESQSLVHLFHATTAIKKHPYAGALKERFSNQPCEMVGVVGAGFMGAGIATVCSDKGVRVRLSDPNKESIARGLKYANDYFKKKVNRRRLTSFEHASKMSQISPALTPSGFNQCDVIIEAVFEDLSLKVKILNSLEAQNNHENWIFASNTSAIPIHEIAKSSNSPERICGMHFFSPVEKMPLLEVVVTDQTADWVAGRCVQLGQQMGKQVIVVKDGPGFYTTRALAFFLAEATNILIEGTPIESIDKALTEFGFPVGPITLIDEVGIDVGFHVLETIEKAFPSRLATPKNFQAILDSGRLGRKNGKGFYLYNDGKKTKPDAEIYEILKLNKEEQHLLTSEEIVDRCLMLFVNESARCLEEGILNTAYDGDVGAVFGLGFPPFRGGPFKYIDFIGAREIVDKLMHLQETYGERFKPAEILVSKANSKEKFFPEETCSTDYQ
ncbi:MAG: fatty acid oxidation complex subunit alpha FadJ [Bdellovibrionota bacterium]